MARYCSKHHYVWHMSGTEIMIICAHCGYTKHTFESLDIDGDMERADHSKRSHKLMCER